VQSSGFAKPLVAAVVILTMISTLGSLALPALATPGGGIPFIEVRPEHYEPEGPPTALAFVEADPAPDGEVDLEVPADDPEEELVDDPEEAVEDPDEAEEEAPDALPPVTTQPPFDLTDIPPYPLPAGFEALYTWNDGDNVMRGTIYAATNGDPGALVAYLSADRGGWTGVDIDDLTGVDPTRQWLYERDDHPYCLWIEHYEKGLEREDLELETGLVGPQFVITETPWCQPFPDPYN